MKYTERIALEQYNYINVTSDNFQELQDAVLEVKTKYASRLFREAQKAPYQSSTPFPQGMQMNESGMTCDTCQAVMVLKTKTSKKTGEPYNAYFCPNWKFGVQGHEMKFPPKKYFGPNA